jgi:AraC family transcriptional regulator
MEQEHTLHIKNMVCDRCIRVVRDELMAMGLLVKTITLGEAVILSGEADLILNDIRAMLEKNGFELLDDRRAKFVEKIKNAIVKLVHYSDLEHFHGKVSDFIANEVDADYHMLSSLFSSMEGVTIERYVILQKIERVKELMKYNELTLSEIAYKLGYSSVAHLSNQFRQVTGMSPSSYKKLGTIDRLPLDRV